MAPPFDSTGIEGRPDAGSLRPRLPATLEFHLSWSRLGPALAGWLLPFGLLVYLALKGGGYDEVVRGEVGIVVSWVLVLGALVGVLPAARIGRVGWSALGLLAAFAAWTALGTVWSNNAERSVAEIGRIAMYVGVFALALAVQGRDGVRRTVSAVAAAIGVVAALALLSRLHPAWFPADDAARFLPEIRSRLNYPLNYWNGLAALMAIGIPLMLAIATRARTLVFQALAAGALPAMALTAYYTLSRGGALEIAVALIVLVALHPRRLTLLPTMVVSAAGAAILIAAANQRDALEQGLGSGAAHSQGNKMLAVVLVVCAGVALIQAAMGLAARYELGPRLRIGRGGALAAWAVAAVAAIVIALAAGLPSRLSHDWQQFKDPVAVAPGGSAERFLSSSGNGRYQYWQSSLDANATDPLLGIGPGTFEYWWSENGTIPGFVVNAHSLYFETLGELGIIGLALIVALLAWVIAVGVRRSLTASRDRTLLAGATAGAAAFAVAAAVDWVWQIAVIPVAFLLLAAAILGPRIGSRAREGSGRLPPRLVLAALSLVALVAIAIPLAATESIRSSQAAARAGDLNAALADARTAADIQPYSATASLQEALVLERTGNLAGAAAAAERATGQASSDWRNWLVLSRLEAEHGNPSRAVAAYRKAKSLNPRSSLFSQ